MPTRSWMAKGSSSRDPAQSQSQGASAAFDKELYKGSVGRGVHLNLLKRARRFATRYEKTLRNDVAVVAIGCALLWLRI
jgi:hypothetical protein